MVMASLHSSRLGDEDSRVEESALLSEISFGQLADHWAGKAPHAVSNETDVNTVRRVMLTRVTSQNRPLGVNVFRLKVHESWGILSLDFRLLSKHRPSILQEDRPRGCTRGSDKPTSFSLSSCLCHCSQLSEA